MEDGSMLAIAVDYQDPVVVKSLNNGHVHNIFSKQVVKLLNFLE